MNFRLFSEYLSRIEAVSSRLEMTDILAKLFEECDEEEVAIVCYLMAARVAPLFIPIEFNVAEKTLRKAAETVVRKHKHDFNVDRAFQRLGDIGEVVEEYLLEQRKKGQLEVAAGNHEHSSLSLKQVYGKLWKVALLGGSGSSEQRQKLIVELVDSVSPLEAKYALRILSQRLRLGAGSKTVLDALSVQEKGNKDDRNELERAYGVCADLGYIAQVYAKSGGTGLRNIRVTPGTPVCSMLVEREKDAESVMKRIKKAIVQPKFDGIRCQIHVGVQKEKRLGNRIWWEPWQSRNTSNTLSMFVPSTREDDVKLFSRNLEDLTSMFPDVVSAARALHVDSAVFDAEIVGFNEATKTYVPFQETMTRKRKYNVSKQVGEVPVRAFVFDLLYVNGRELVHERNDARIEELREIVGERGLIGRASSHTATTANELRKIFNDSISSGLEGVVVKDVESVYEPGVRSLSWIKLKRAFQGHLADSVDVVILGYYHGRGKQASLGMGALLGGVYDQDRDGYVTLTKIGTGITEDQWKLIKKDLDALTLKEIPPRVYVHKNLVPDVWVKPEIVVTVEADEITRSPVHTAGVDKSGAGYALRFPRLKVWKRDRLAEDTRISEVVALFNSGRSRFGR
jgi:DNA ligase 1